MNVFHTNLSCDSSTIRVSLGRASYFNFSLGTLGHDSSLSLITMQMKGSVSSSSSLSTCCWTEFFQVVLDALPLQLSTCILSSTSLRYIGHLLWVHLFLLFITFAVAEQPDSCLKNHCLWPNGNPFTASPKCCHCC